MTELAASLSDGGVWRSFLAVFAAGALCFVLGRWIARRTGILGPDSPIGEVIGVALGVGLVVLASVWGALASGGRSAFTPIAVLVGVACLLSMTTGSAAGRSPSGVVRSALIRHLDRAAIRAGLWPAVGAIAFVVVVGLTYGATVAPSPRDGEQPVEFQDEVFYSVLARDLSSSGIESVYSPSGFGPVPDLPAQTWYHWGDIWLSAAAATTFGLEPMLARHYVVLPLILLASACLTGTFVRRVSGHGSRGAFAFGVAACLLLAPIPLPPTFFSRWPTGQLFGVTTYGLAVVAALLVLYLLVSGAFTNPARGTAPMAGAIAASLVPAHVVIAVLGLIAAAGAAIPWLWTVVRSRGQAGRPSSAVRRAAAILGVSVIATFGWGLLTGHGIGISGLSPRVTPFNATWMLSVLSFGAGAGLFLAIPIELFLERRTASTSRLLLLGSGAMLIAGAAAWGARLGDFTMFYLLYGGIAVIAAPVAAAATWSLWAGARRAGRPLLATALIVGALFQLEFGVIATAQRLEQFGRAGVAPFSESFLADVRNLPAGSLIAYACNPAEELAFWNPRLISLDLHTGHHVVPMCFESDVFSALSGAPESVDAPSPLFRQAPQRTLYPTAASVPSPEAVLAFFNAHGIEYIYADGEHPNSLVPDAVPIATGGGAEVLRLP